MTRSTKRDGQSKAPLLRCLSLGAGVQSTTMALMAAHGALTPMPDCAIFADTGWDPQSVYDHLAWLQSGNVLPFPVHIVSKSDLRADLVRGARDPRHRFAAVPFFTHAHRPAGSLVPVLDDVERIVGHRVLTRPDDQYGIGRRQCTYEYKIQPIAGHLRKMLGYAPRARVPAGAVDVWIGISMDEVFRMKPSRVNWQTNRWPLIEQRMRRRGCLSWLSKNGYSEPPKSSCIGCPYHSDAHWRAMRDDAPDEWEDAVRMDRLIRNTGTQRGLRAQQYLHRSCQPLDEVDLDAAHDRDQLDLMLDECEGMCGV